MVPENGHDGDVLYKGGEGVKELGFPLLVSVAAADQVAAVEDEIGLEFFHDVDASGMDLGIGS